MKRFALIGRHLGHSYSQRWFEELFARLDLVDHSYRLVEMPSVEGLREWVRKEGINGFNVTVPYKQEILAQLDALDKVAEAIGAVNCVTVEGGRLIGHNTDAPAFRKTLGEMLPSDNHPLPTALVLGTGGAARAVAYALDQMGIPYHFVSRHPELHPNAIGYNDLSISQFPFSILINATPVGMYPDVDAMPLPGNLHFSSLDYSNSSRCCRPSRRHTTAPLRDTVSNFQFVYDLIYNPSPTRLLREAAACGAQVKDGLEMLHLQAELSWNLFQQC